MKRIALLTTIVFLTLSMVAITWELRSVVVVFLVAMAIAATLDAPVEWFVQHRWPRMPVVVAVHLAIFGAFLGLLSGIFLLTIRELDPLARDLVSVYATVHSRLLNLSGTGTAWVTQLPMPEQLATSLTAGQTTALLRGIVGTTQNLGSYVGQFLLATVLAIYLAIDHTRFERLWLSLLPPEQRSRTRRFWRKLNADVGAYIRSELLQTVLAGILLASGYWLLGIKYPFLLALFAALASLVPLLGGVVALIPLAMIGWLSGPLPLLLGLIYTIIVLVFLKFFVEPRVHQHERYWGVLVVLVMMVLGNAMGLLGLLVAPPIAVAIQSWLNEILNAPVAAEVDLDALQVRLVGIHERVNDGHTTVSPRHASLLARLDGLMVQMKEEGVD